MEKELDWWVPVKCISMGIFSGLMWLYHHEAIVIGIIATIVFTMRLDQQTNPQNK